MKRINVSIVLTFDETFRNSESARLRALRKQVVEIWPPWPETLESRSIQFLPRSAIPFETGPRRRTAGTV